MKTAPDQLPQDSSEKTALHPPAELVNLVGGDFASVGAEFLGYLKTLSRLRPEHAVLDIGSGCGRLAAPLSSYLGPGGRYEGIEIHAESVRWCRENIHSQSAPFRFQTADIFNGFYNPQGSVAARDYRFPFEEGTFDRVLFVSVFTHMLPEDVTRYLSEAHRVLKKGGEILATFFLINPESWKTIQAREHEFPYEKAQGGYYFCNSKIHEDVTAYDETWVRETLRQIGFQNGPKVFYGRWTRRADALSFQDLLLTGKTDS
ncbi:MAG: class I SAM-dependent methyltransferase [Candidatus Omnitrophica bacterium]|nr:class I SAM-dependent methyltransferase [Candidatus Omnitrophota bacterium]